MRNGFASEALGNFYEQVQYAGTSECDIKSRVREFSWRHGVKIHGKLLIRAARHKFARKNSPKPPRQSRDADGLMYSRYSIVHSYRPYSGASLKGKISIRIV